MRVVTNITILAWAMIAAGCAGTTTGADAGGSDVVMVDESGGQDTVANQDTKSEVPACHSLCDHEGARVCQGAGYLECVDLNDDGCLEWSKVKPCGDGNKCKDGLCVKACPDQECTAAGARQCKDNTTVVSCGDYNGNGCLEWGGEEACHPGLVCSNGFCSKSCSDECTTVGAMKCDGNAVVTCKDYNNDGCLEWAKPKDCGTQVCSNGLCKSQCQDECTQVGARKCEGNGYITCGNYNGNNCLEWGTVTTCSPGLVCSNGFCSTTCKDECTVQGAKKCVLNAVAQCKDTNNDGCLEWTTPNACPNGTSCNEGVCEQQCKDECSVKGAKKCDEAGNVVQCVDVNGKGCLKWGSPVPCEAPTVCNKGACTMTCADECPKHGARQCAEGSANQYQECGDWDKDGCLEWGTPQPCPGTDICSGGQCMVSCIDECPSDGAKECSDNGWHVCGDWDKDGCLEWGTITYCKDYEVCKAGTCGKKTPPAGVLISEVLYDSPGYPDKESFVELFGPAGTDLTGFYVVGVNGSNGKDYNKISLSGTKIGPDGFFVIADPDSSAQTQAQADMLDKNVDFQNGPDSIQLRFGTQVVDGFAYGTFSQGQHSAGEGTPSPKVSKPGHSQGRDADETDTNDNFMDFHEFTDPTPGAPNVVPNAPPTAQLMCPGPALVGDEVSFNGSASSDPDGDVVQYAFDFGDGRNTSGETAAVKHVYTAAGSYVVTLTVTDNQGATDSTTCDMTISTPKNKPPTAKLTCPDGALKAGQELGFDASGSTDPDGTITSYGFDFGDNGTVSGTSPTAKHTYSSQGKYTVAVTVTDDDGATAQAQCTFDVGPAGPPDRTITTDTELCGYHEFGKLSIMGGAGVTCPDGAIDIRASEVLIDPASSIDVSRINAQTDAGIYKFCTQACICDPGYTGGGGGGNATAGEKSPYTSGDARSPEYDGCLGSCVSFTCSGAKGGSARGTGTEMDAPQGGAGGTGCASGYSTCSTPSEGGKGGGSVRILATRSITVQGSILADGGDGTDGTAGSGGGAGGSIVLAAPSLTLTGKLSAGSGTGGSGSKPPSYWSKNNANGGNGGKGLIKLCHGAQYTNTATMSKTGTLVVETVMSPIDVTSATHPDPSQTYNDTFQDFQVSWTRPFPEATGYWYALNNNPGFVLTPLNGTYTANTSVTFPASTFTKDGTWYFRVLSVDTDGVIGTVAWRFDIHINGNPPVISSSSHPNPAKWYPGTAIALSWTPPKGVSKDSFKGFYYRLDRTSDESPANARKTWTHTTNSQVVLTKDADGNAISSFAYHFHVVAEDTMDNLTRKVATFLVQVGTEPEKTGFFGYVKDPGGTPIKGASVRLEPYGLQQTTDANGYFLMANIYKGPYTLKAGKTGYNDVVRSVQVGTDPVPFNITLSQ